MTKRGSSFEYESSHIHKGRVSIRDFFCQGECYTLRDVVRTYVFFSFLLLWIHCSYFMIANLVFITDVIYMMKLLLRFFHLSLHVLFLFSLYAHASYLLYAIFYFVSH